jgi:hypothetical protein
MLTKHERRKLAGFCTYCGTRKPRPNRATCAVCVETMRVSRRQKETLRASCNLCIICGLPSLKNKKKCKKCTRKMAEYSKKSKDALKLRVLMHYSKGTLVCDCCDENLIEFLSIDHINGGGKQHRVETGLGKAFYRWLERHNYPTGYRVLCFNCNMSYGLFGYCPHQTTPLNHHRHRDRASVRASR